MKLTQANVDGAVVPEGKTDYIHWDEELKGFGLRLRTTGRRSFVIQYRGLGGQQRREKIGDAFKLTAAQARQDARVRLAKVELGRDPAAERQAEQERAKLLFRFVASQYIETAVKKLRPNTQRDYIRYLTVDFAPFDRIPIHLITRRHVASRVAEIEKRGASTAARARATLSALFVWAMKRGLVEANPVIGTEMPETADPRKRVLADSEVREIWNACLEDDFGRIIRLCILTGCRREEIASLRWSELRQDEHGNTVLEILGSRTKNHRDLRLILPPKASRIVQDSLKREGRDPVFGLGPNGFLGFSAAKARLDSRILAARRERDPEASPMPHWTLHDLRRTFVTGLNTLKVKPHIVEVCVNHTGGFRSGVAGTYNLSTYEEEVRDALVLWARHVDQVVHPREPLRVVG